MKMLNEFKRSQEGQITKQITDKCKQMRKTVDLNQMLLAIKSN